MKKYLFLLLFATSLLTEAAAYPIDGYLFSGIRRLVRLERIMGDELEGKKLPAGALKSIEYIKLYLAERPETEQLDSLPEPDTDLQKQLSALFPRLDESYSITLLDISPGKPIRYAKRQEDRGFQPGSVGKLAVITGFFAELAKIYPDSFSLRHDLMRSKSVRAGGWAIYDEHTVPFFDPETNKLVKRQVQEKDVFTLYEWCDHMMSVSNNGAASVVWREALLMRVFGQAYPELTEEQAEEYFKTTPKPELAELAIQVVNDPLQAIGISRDEWRLGQMFTRGATARIPGKGGSIGSPRGMMKWLVALEQGKIVDHASSLEIKRLMYMTDNRIRYAANAELRDAAVYFKSGSLYSCNKKPDDPCGKYRGNVQNYMNSVAIIERGDSTVYLVALMTNVLRRNSNNDHNALAGKIDKLVRGE